MMRWPPQTARANRLAQLERAHDFAGHLRRSVHFRFLPYTPLVAYGQSKTACALLAVEATRRWQNEGIFANALNPGAIATNLSATPAA